MKQSVPIKDSWKFCPLCGASPKKTGGHPFKCDQCNYCHYFSPCTAVGALIVDASDNMLFIVRGKDPGKGKLGLPGGFVDSGETAEQSLIREIREELNLAVTEFRYLASFPNTYDFGGVITTVTDLFYVSQVASLDNIQPQEGEIIGWKFLPIDDVTEDMLAFATHQQALNVFRKQQSGS